MPCYIYVPTPDLIVRITSRPRGSASPRGQISLAVDCVRRMTRPVQDQPSPLDMRLQADVLASDPDQVADYSLCIPV
jgi:hypothetical protein